jgi:hypothetical protein
MPGCVLGRDQPVCARVPNSSVCDSIAPVDKTPVLTGYGKGVAQKQKLFKK